MKGWQFAPALIYHFFPKSLSEILRRGLQFSGPPNEKLMLIHLLIIKLLVPEAKLKPNMVNQGTKSNPYWVSDFKK